MDFFSFFFLSLLVDVLYSADAGHDLNANRGAWTASRGCVVIRFCCRSCSLGEMGT